MEEKIGRSSDGKFTKGNDIGVAGKPKGCLNKSTLAIHHFANTTTRMAISARIAARASTR